MYSQPDLCVMSRTHQEAAQNLISHLASSPPLTSSAHLLTTSSFLSRYSTLVLPSCSRSGSSKDQEQAGISERDCKILLRYLERDKKVLVADEKGEVSQQAELHLRGAFVTDQGKSAFYCPVIIGCG
jgi:hypothetical protein